VPNDVTTKPNCQIQNEKQVTVTITAARSMTYAGSVVSFIDSKLIFFIHALSGPTQGALTDKRYAR